MKIKGKSFCWEHAYMYILLDDFSRDIRAFRASLVAQVVKNMPEMQETQVQPLARENPVEKGMAAHSSILAWRIPWMEEPDGMQSMALQRVRKD